VGGGVVLVSHSCMVIYQRVTDYINIIDGCDVIRSVLDRIKINKRTKKFHRINRFRGFRQNNFANNSQWVSKMPEWSI